MIVLCVVLVLCVVVVLLRSVMLNLLRAVPSVRLVVMMLMCGLGAAFCDVGMAAACDETVVCGACSAACCDVVAA